MKLAYKIRGQPGNCYKQNDLSPDFVAPPVELKFTHSLHANPQTLSSEMGQANKQHIQSERQAWKGSLAASQGKHMMFLGLHRAVQPPSSELALNFKPQDGP